MMLPVVGKKDKFCVREKQQASLTLLLYFNLAAKQILCRHYNEDA